VSILDDTHGWLKVRAEMNGGEVTTSLTVSSPAHDALRSTLPEIAAYLHSEGVGVTRIDLHRSSNPGASDFGAAAPPANASGNNDNRQHRESSTSPAEDQRSQQSTGGEQQTAAGTPASTRSSVAGWMREAARSLPLVHSRLLSSSGFTGGWVNMSA
jgi:hypothetical protein